MRIQALKLYQNYQFRISISVKIVHFNENIFNFLYTSQGLISCTPVMETVSCTKVMEIVSYTQVMEKNSCTQVMEIISCTQVREIITSTQVMEIVSRVSYTQVMEKKILYMPSVHAEGI